MAQTSEEKAVQGIKDPTARKKAFYTLQRDRAEESGDQKTTNKIYGKLGRKSHNVDSSAVDKGILATVAGFAGGGPAALGEKLAAGGARKLAPALFEKGEAAVSGLAKKAGSAMEKAYQDLGRAKPIAKKLTGKAATTARQKAETAGPKALMKPKDAPQFSGKKSPTKTYAGTDKFRADGSRKVKETYKKVELRPNKNNRFEKPDGPVTKTKKAIGKAVGELKDKIKNRGQIQNKKLRNAIGDMKKSENLGQSAKFPTGPERMEMGIKNVKGKAPNTNKSGVSKIKPATEYKRVGPDTYQRTYKIKKKAA